MQLDLTWGGNMKRSHFSSVASRLPEAQSACPWERQAERKRKGVWCHELMVSVRIGTHTCSASCRGISEDAQLMQ